MADRVFIIAEAGVNHNGSLDVALRLVDVAAEAGADAVKFQTFRADAVASRFAPKAEYQQVTTGESGSQLEMLRRLELDAAAHHAIAQHCRERGIEFMSSPFDLESARFLTRELGVQRVKLGSGELTNAPLLLEVGRSGLPVILSTGMSTEGDVAAAVGVLAFAWSAPEKEGPSCEHFERALQSPEARARLRERLTLLHCTTEYPAPFADVNLRAMDAMRERFGVRVGLSDHTAGISVALAAAARGAEVIEKHFTLDRAMPGPDHPASLQPGELKAMVQGIREVEQALGSGAKQPAPSEVRNRSAARKSLVAACAIAAGEPFTAANIAIKRPGTGLSPMQYWRVLGQRAPRSFEADEPITL